VVVDDQQLELTGDGFTMSLAGTDATGQPTKVGANGRLFVDESGNVQVAGSGVQPGSQVDLWVMSDPVYLGTVTVNAQGNFSANRPLPAGVPVGDHTVQANGVTSDGAARSLNIGIEVVESATLPATGSTGDLTMSLALVTACLGAFLALASRRRVV
jgi:LPXTG-motif cell wall-anchored protein